MALKEIYILNLKKYRQKEELSQMKLAEYCNTSLGYIGEIEIGRKFPSTEMIEKIAAALRIEPHLLFMKLSAENVKSDIEEKYSRLPYKIKKQIHKQMKAKIKTHIDQSVTEIYSEINDVLDKY